MGRGKWNWCSLVPYKFSSKQVQTLCENYMSLSQNFHVSQFWQLPDRSGRNLSGTRYQETVFQKTNDVSVWIIIPCISQGWLVDESDYSDFIFIFLIIKRNYIIFDLRNFLFDADQNAPFPILTFLRLTHFSYIEIGNFSDDFMYLNETSNFHTPREATCRTILCFWTSDINFIPRWKVTGGFYVLNKLCNFCQVNI